MDDATYDRKRKELASKYPVYVSESWLRMTRILVSILLLILNKVSQFSLPVWDIKCLHDNVLEAFEKLQSYFSTPSLIIACELLLFFFFFFCVIGISAHWILYSESLKLPIVVLIFYIVKLLSDCALVVDKPPKMIWQDIPLFGTTITYHKFFLGNIDPITGLILISFLYSFSIKEQFMRYLMIAVSFFGLFYAIIMQLVFELVHSYAVYSAIIATGFAFIVTVDLLEYIQRQYNVRSLDKQGNVKSATENLHEAVTESIPLSF